MKTAVVNKRINAFIKTTSLPEVIPNEETIRALRQSAKDYKAGKLKGVTLEEFKRNLAKY